jgi:hydrogenase maturation protease
MASPDAPTLVVLGLGNLLMGDDGLGVRAVERLAAAFAPDATTHFLDGGTLGLALLPYIERADALLVVDAVATGARPGTLVRLEADDVPRRVDVRLSPHELGVVDILAGATFSGRRPEPTILLGVVPADISFGVELSSAVERSLPALIDTIVAEAHALGHRFTPIPPP